METGRCLRDAVNQEDVLFSCKRLFSDWLDDGLRLCGLVKQCPSACSLTPLHK